MRCITAICVMSAALCAGGCRVAGEAPVVAFLGDSNLWIGGDDCANPRSWSYWFCQKTSPLAARCYARSGATWTHTADTKIDTAFYSEVLASQNVVRPQTERLIGSVSAGWFPSPTLIFIAAGTNDAWFAERRPGLWGDDISVPTTLTGSIAASVNRLHEVFPEARIILLTPPPTAATTPDRIERVSDIIVTTAGRLAVEVVRLDTISQIEPAREKRVPRYTTDGTHTSPEGAMLIANTVFNTLYR